MIILKIPRTLTNTKSNTSILRLPKELIHIIYTNLEPPEIANFRLLHSSVTALGIEYLIPEAYLSLTDQTFQRLDALSKHRLLSQHVTSLIYCADSLPVLGRVSWEGQIRSPEIREAVIALDDHYEGDPGSEVGNEARKKELERLMAPPLHRYSQQELDRACWDYEHLIAEQKHIRTSTKYADWLTKIILRFPRFHSVTMDIGSIFKTLDIERRTQHAVAATFCVSNANKALESPTGVSQTRAFLNVALEAGAKIKELFCGSVNWQLLGQDAETFTQMKGSLASLRSFDIVIGSGTDANISKDEHVQSRKLLEEGRLTSLLSSCPLLKYLSVVFDQTWYHCPVQLRHVVGEFQWSQLSSFYLDNIYTTEEDLLGFLARHTSTLKHMSLSDMHLTRGCWATVFQSVRRMMKLGHVELESTCCGDLDGHEKWNLDYSDEPEEDRRIRKLRKAVEDFMMGHSTEASVYDFLEKRGILKPSRS